MTTTLAVDVVTAEAVRLDEAERTRTQTSPLTARYPDATIDDAYAVQAAWVARKLERGRTVVGHKIGLTSRAMQAAMGIDTPDSGVLLDDMVFDEGTTIDAGAFCDPRVEVELAFVLGRDLDEPGASSLDVLSATERIVPAVELIAARSHRVDPETGRARTVVDTISDNAANAGIITGGRAVRPDDLDLRWAGAVLTRNGVVEETGLAAGVLNDPARGVAWLARRYAAQGRSLGAGQVVLAVSFTRPVTVRPGDVFHADFGRLGAFGFAFS